MAELVEHDLQEISKKYIQAFKSENVDITKLNKFCIDVLKHHLKPNDFPKPIFPKEFEIDFKVPVFVTWLDESSSEYNKRLRGCIGTFHPDLLEKQLRKFTIVSAREDDRFKSVEFEELKNFSMSVSILEPLMQTKDIYDWEIGTHGVYVNFNDHKGTNFNACYLPEVPIINKWDQKLTLDRCVKKSGFADKLGHLDDVAHNMVVLKFKSIKSGVNCKDYL